MEVNPIVKRAGGYALVGSISLTAPILGQAVFVPFAIVAILALVVVTDGPLFELFARPGDYEEQRLFGLTSFSLSATALGILIMFGLPIEIFTVTICLLVFGNLIEVILRTRGVIEAGAVTGFVVGGVIFGMSGFALTGTFTAESVASLPAAVALVTTGALVAAILRTMLFEHDDPLILLSVGLLLWFFTELGLATSAGQVAIAIAVTAALGYISYALDTASITGMLTGVLLGLLTIILGGYGWFAVLIAFFAIGGLATKYKYVDKFERGVAEPNQGARGTGNVLSNSAVGLLAVIGYAATPTIISINSLIFLFAFCGAIATALGDTVSSEIGGVYDDPRLITSFETVAPGTDGAVTVQGSVAGIGGATVIGVTSLLLFDPIGWLGCIVIIAAGIIGMTADSIIGATVEGRVLNNQGVNFAATMVGAIACVGFGVMTGAL